MTWYEAVEQNGFAIIPDVLSSQDITGILNDLKDSTLRRSRAGVRHALDSAEITRLSRDSQLLRIARDVLGNCAFPFRATLFDKSSSANWLVVWHQDTALPIQERRETPGWGPWSVKEGVIYAHAPAAALSQVLALRVHLDDSTAQNGPLRVLPATHKLGVLNDDAMHLLATQIAPVDCLVPRGGVLAMRPLLVHASSKSQVAAPRRVLHIEYAASAVLTEGLSLAVAGNQILAGAVK
jgi:ectoine hydroxylase-related dioxygenase (phytanoyl-CoA dioxygenase family)